MASPEQRSLTAREVADLVGGKLEGDPAVVITGVASLRDAEVGQASFLEAPHYAPFLASTRASLVLLPPDLVVPPGANLLRVPRPSVAIGRLVDFFLPPPPRPAAGVHPRAVVDPSAKVHPSASIQPCAVIEAGAEVGEGTVIGAGCYLGHDARIGRDCLLYPNVTVRERCLVGNRVILHPGVVIGSDGFGYDFSGGRYHKVPQVGIVQLDDDVEIGSNSTVDRGRFGRTWVKRGVKLDNLVQVAHNVVVGEDTAVASQVGISGSTQIGHHVRIAGQAGIVGHISIGDGATVMAQSGVSRDVEKGTTVFGYPALEQAEAMRMYAGTRRLPQVIERLRKLEKQLTELLGKPKP